MAVGLQNVFLLQIPDIPGEEGNGKALYFFKQTQKHFDRIWKDSFQLKLETRLHTLKHNDIPRCEM